MACKYPTRINCFNIIIFRYIFYVILYLISSNYHILFSAIECNYIALYKFIIIIIIIIIIILQHNLNTGEEYYYGLVTS